MVITPAGFSFSGRERTSLKTNSPFQKRKDEQPWILLAVSRLHHRNRSISTTEPRRMQQVPSVAP
ncbi:MAG: hypothetical protein D6806_00085 [Deltaproteobacteria bacterium]|nr:MAG: hypothetical protein D6806_00085 [Deltaproteobacteria bacterium]